MPPAGVRLTTTSEYGLTRERWYPTETDFAEAILQVRSFNFNTEAEVAAGLVARRWAERVRGCRRLESRARGVRKMGY